MNWQDINTMPVPAHPFDSYGRTNQSCIDWFVHTNQMDEQEQAWCLYLANSSMPTSQPITLTPMVMQTHLNDLYKKVLIEYQLASELCVDMTQHFLGICNFIAPNHNTVELLMDNSYKENLNYLSHILHENQFNLFLESLESVFIKDWSVRLESVTGYIQPLIFYKKHVDHLCHYLFKEMSCSMHPSDIDTCLLYTSPSPRD